MKNLLKRLSLSQSELIFLGLSLIFSLFLMWKTFKVDTSGNLLIASRVWSDFSANIPLIRSFAFGFNFPPQYPIFAGPPIRYHFVFYFLVGMLERIGLPIDFSLNILSSMGMFSLMVFIYLFSKSLFKSKAVGFISVLFFVFNGSLGFIEFFKIHPLGMNSLNDIFTNKQFSSFGPYDNKIVSAFWSLNIYTNQRHLAAAYAIFLAILLSLYYFDNHPERLTKTKTILIGFVFGLMPFFHLAVFGMIGIMFFTSLIIFRNIWRKIFVIGAIGAILALPQIYYMGRSNIESSLFYPGYLSDPKNIISFLNYWFMNLGLTIFTGAAGFLLAKRNQRKIILPFLALFIVGNLFKFSPEIAANHKFFNLFLIGVNMFSAYFIVRLWKIGLLTKPLVPIFILLLILTGIIDFFPIKNDTYITLQDIPTNQVANFIYKSTPENSVFLNANFLYDPASLAGRKIYLGWPYFSWSAGYNTDLRFSTMKQLLYPENKKIECMLIKQEKIDYIELQQPTQLEDTTINYAFFANNFQKIYSDNNGYFIYDVRKSCI